MIKRPRPGENEEDILKMQEEFLKDKNIQPSAQIVNLRKTEHNTTKRSSSNLKKQSKYAQSKGLNNSEKGSCNVIKNDSIMGDILEKNIGCDEGVTATCSKSTNEDDKVYFPEVIGSVLGNIIEKNYDDFEVSDTIAMPATGFPVATKRDFGISKNINVQHNNDIDMVQASDNSNISVTNNLNLPKKSFIITNDDANSIHNENINLLNNMTEQEILDERAKLLKSLDTNLVDFIRNKRKHKILQENEMKHDSLEAIENDKMDITETESVKINIADDTLWENDVLSHPQVNTWFHFDNLEKDKLEWMKGIEESKKVNPNEPYEARFDFKGYLLPYTLDYTEKTKTLFHHGEESHRPGYSVLELFELTRSSVIQQRVMALNTLAGILEYNSTGIYKNIIDIPISKIFFVIRIALDENKVIILDPALRALRNLIFNRIDEASLDALIGFKEGTYQPCLENDKSEIEDMESNESELKDFHLAEIDIVAALIRTEILQRLYYVFENVKPSFNCVQYSLQILSRLARDSVETAKKIVETDHLMIVIINSFLPTTSINFLFEPNIVYNGKPILAALKLFRILSLQSKEIGEMLISKYNLLEPISTYISSGVDGTYGLRIQIEAFCILSNLLSYNIGSEKAVVLAPVVVVALYKHVEGTDMTLSTSVLSITHAAVLIQYINNLLYCNTINLDSIKEQIYPLLKQGLQKWLSQAASFVTYTCGHLRLLCSLLHCCKTIMEIENVSFKFLNDLLIMLANSTGFKTIVQNVMSCSNLLSKLEENDLFTIKNLRCLGAVIIPSSKKVLPILQQTSPIPFLASLFNILCYLNNQDISQIFTNQLNEYVQKISTRPLYLTNNWFTRMEIDLLYYVVKLSVSNDISEPIKDITYAVASKLCYILRVDKRYELEYLFDNIIFKKQWFTAERLFNLVSLSETDGFTKALTNIEDIRICYSSVMNLKQIHPRNIVLRDWQQPILPRDWIYLPILSLYSKSQEVISSPTIYGDHAKKVALTMAEAKELIIRCSLEWILFNEMCFPDLLNDIDVTDRFCRLMCVFLCDNSLFLDEKLKILLHKCTQILFKHKTNLNFDKELTGVHNFQDLYTQFLEQFQSVSYGDPTFASCVLVPIAQRHNNKWRKLLWSEYAGCLAYLNCPEDYLCYELNEYLYPEETDESLIKCYFRALSSNVLRPNSIAFKIAQHHIKIFKERKM